MKQSLFIVGMALAETAHHTLHICSVPFIAVGVAVIGVTFILNRVFDCIEKMMEIEEA